MTFQQAFANFGHDVERIASETGIAPPEVDRRINAAMNAAYLERAPAPAVVGAAPIVTKKLVRYAGYDARGSV